MGYASYVTPEHYISIYNGSIVPEEELEKALKQSSRHIDSLTCSRIVDKGFFNLTEFQQDAIQDVVCQQADFEHENAEMIDTVLSGYSLNGATVQFGQSWNVHISNGIAMRRDVYATLSQTGLCGRLAVGR